MNIGICISFTKAKQIIYEKNIISKEHYYIICDTDNRLSKEPEILYELVNHNQNFCLDDSDLISYIKYLFFQLFGSLLHKPKLGPDSLEQYWAFLLNSS